jgi:hypothetical protein
MQDPEFVVLIEHRQPERLLLWVGPFHAMPYMGRNIDPVAGFQKNKFIFSFKSQGCPAFEEQYKFPWSSPF